MLLIGKQQVRFAYAYVDTRLWGVCKGADPLCYVFFGDTRFRRRKLRIACFALSGKSALIPLRLLSKSQPLRWVAILYLPLCHVFPNAGMRHLI